LHGVDVAGISLFQPNEGALSRAVSPVGEAITTSVFEQAAAAPGWHGTYGVRSIVAGRYFQKWNATAHDQLNVSGPIGAETSAARHSSKEKSQFRYRTLTFQPDKWPFLLSSIIMFVLLLEKLKNLSIP